MTDADRIDALLGQVAALKGCLIALIHTHQDPAAVARALAGLREAAKVKILNSPASDESQEAADEIYKDLVEVAKKVAARRE